MTLKEKTALFGGQARLPRELSNSEIFQAIGEVEIATGKVVSVEFSPCPPIIAALLGRLIVGMVLPDDLNDVLNEIDQRVFYKGKKAVITAIKDMGREFREFQYRASKGYAPPEEG